MFKVEKYEGSKENGYSLVRKQLKALIEGEENVVANLSNASALLNQFLDNINWVGFYLYEEKSNQLVLGPFQGLPACIRIPLGRGVCGTAAEKRETLLVEDVSKFPGHIACDAASQSEIVVPIVKNDTLIGVLDIDSPETFRFDKQDKEKLEEFVQELVKHI
ncbi:GAF domain-containing protein [Bacillus seohaeanensis]|uniref:GAF domain-containing protein n=1 Tax=Bacillus seohaeanensis TaxID=284580 RepID=A0ABW5RSD7_9BACI